MNRRTTPRVFHWCSVLASMVMLPLAACPKMVVASEVALRTQDQSVAEDEFSEETRAAFAEIRNTFLSALKAKGLERKKLLDETYDRIVDVTSSNRELSPARTVWAKLLLSVGDQKAARQALQLATLELPRDPEAFILLANLAFGSGQFGESRLLFDHALDNVARLAPDAPRRKGLLIQIYSGRSNVIEA